MIYYTLCCNVILRKKCFLVIICITGIWILYICISSPYQLYLSEVHSFLGISAHRRKLEWDKSKVNFTLVSCTPKTNVTFFKTHKTASCTVQNIFLRYAREKNRMMLLPAVGNYFGHPQFFVHTMAPALKKGYKYNILCHHHRWNYVEVQKIMPENTAYVTILRDPVKVFESLYFYANLSTFYKQDLKKFALADNSSYRHHMVRKNGLGRNQMSYDLGFRDVHFGNSTVIERFLYSLKEQFDLVMIAERMEESLILLKDLLCWSIDDVVVFNHNQRLPETKVKLSEAEKTGLRRWSNVDLKLYKFFDELLQKRIADYGEERMAMEREELRSRTELWYDYCVQDKAVAAKVPKKFRPYHPQTYGFILNANVTNSTCESLIMGELPFSDLLRQRQQKYYILPKKKTTTRRRRSRRTSRKRP